MVNRQTTFPYQLFSKLGILQSEKTHLKHRKRTAWRKITRLQRHQRSPLSIPQIQGGRIRIRNGNGTSNGRAAWSGLPSIGTPVEHMSADDAGSEISTNN